ncbi:MAG TPA: hypothetical protein PKE45_16050 [Caldilineaceae bacterium]|nr:hypothetical protein [Caldilineaceae bacterium]
MELYGYPVGDLMVLLVIAAVGGALVQWFAGYSPGGCLISLVFAFLGAWLASWLVVQFRLPGLFVWPVAGQQIELIWPLIGAVLFVLILSFTVQRLIADL